MSDKTPRKFPIPPLDDSTERNLRIQEAIRLAIIAESAGCLDELAAMALSPAFAAYASPPCEVHRVAGKDVEFRNGMFWFSPQLPPLFSPARNTPYKEVDEIRAAYRCHTISRDEAVVQIRRACDVTDAGAADMLDHELSPTERLPRIRMREITKH